MPFRIAHFGDDGSRDRLTQAVSLASEPMELVAGEPRSFEPEVIVVGPDTPEPLNLAQRLRAETPPAQILFLIPSDRLERFRSSLPFVPHMASAWTADAASPPIVLADLLVRAARASAQRASMAVVADRINVRLGRSAVQNKAHEAENRRLQQLAFSEDYLATLLSQAPDAIVAISLDGVVLAWNEAAERLLGVAGAAAVGRDARDVFPHGAYEALLPLLESGQAGARLGGQEMQLDLAGEARWVEISIAPILDRRGQVTTISMSLRDVSDRKAAEALLSQSAEDLARRVDAEVAARLEAENALRQAQKMEAVGQLTGGIAHDFNNLLQGITGSLELLQRRVSQGRLSELDRFIAGATASANRASTLTHRLLAFARRQPLDPSPVRVNPLVRSMEELLRRTLGERIELEVVLAGGLWLTRCDANQLESAILNLAINARDAMPDGGKLIIETGNAHLDASYVARHRHVKAGQYVCVAVTDTGVGMDEETRSRAFEPFFTTKPIGQGTGLGLSMIYGFAKQSEGHTMIYSEVGRGTTFKLYLPRLRETAPVEEPETEAAAVQVSHLGETVLVVEDEPLVRSLILEVLEELGYNGLEAADGPAGLEIIQSSRPIDLLITDIGLPGLNGRQLADAARQARPGLKVLFMTGYAENAALASGFLEPGMAMVTKPFAMDALSARIREIIEEGGGNGRSK